MADIDQIIAGGAGASSRADFSGIADIPKTFFEGNKARAEFDLRRAFKDGVPTLPDGSIDYGTMQRTLYQKGGLEQGNALSGISARAGELAALNGADGPQQPIVSPPSVNRGAAVPVAPALNKGGEVPQNGGPQGAPQGGATVMKVLAAQGIPNDQLGAASASIARQLGVDPTAPLDLQDPQVRNVLAPAVAQIKRMGLGQVQPPQPGDNPPQAAPAVPAPLQPTQVQVAAQNDPVLKRLTLLTASQDKQIAAAAKVRLEAYLKNQESTTEMKNAGASGLTLPAYQERQGELASQQAGSTERAKADVKEQQEIISAGRGAQARLGTINTITNVVNSDKNLSLGFGSETTLKIKMALEQAGMDFGDLSGAQLIQKLNGVLASESSKSFSSRPTQFEFKTFLANNPGLALDEKGNVRMLGILAQNAKREADLGKLARQNQDNWQKWDDVVENYDKTHPIKDPTTGKVLSNHSIIAPVGKPQAQPASGTQRFSSPSDVHAAVAAGKLKSGDAFLTSDGKTKYVP